LKRPSSSDIVIVSRIAPDEEDHLLGELPYGSNAKKKKSVSLLFDDDEEGKKKDDILVGFSDLAKLPQILYPTIVEDSSMNCDDADMHHHYARWATTAFPAHACSMKLCLH
jgi:hypothetical protein